MSTLDTGGNDDPICSAIDAAEEVRDPLDGLVERTGTDAGAALHPKRSNASRRSSETIALPSRRCGRN
jgi:hypothetical protein